MAAMKVSPAPTGTEVNSPSFTPCFTARYWVRKLVDEPRPVTPRLVPLKSAGDLISGCLVETSSTSPGRAEDLHHGLDEFALGLQVDAMVVEAADALHGAGQQLVLGIDARRLGQEFDVEALVLEVAEALRRAWTAGRSASLAAHHDGDLVGGKRRAMPKR